MNTIKNIIENGWKWFYDRTALWLVLLIGLTFMFSLNNLNIEASKLKQSSLNCKISCHPKAYEYIQNNSENSCWCYQDTSTLTISKK